jgi:hypothetical protein
MKNVLIGLMMLAAIPAAVFGQTGTDINQAIPIYFGQTINDIIDNSTRPWQVYSIALSKGQQVTATAAANTINWEIFLLGSGTTTIAGNFNALACANYNCGTAANGNSVSYQIATAGTYYVAILAKGGGVTYNLQVTAQGTPITSPNPPQAGCLTGQVNNITYSLQLISAGLPDTVTIGSTQACASCTVKPPAYPALVQKMETAMGLGVGVSACYDSSGNIFQLTLNHP